MPPRTSTPAGQLDLLAWQPPEPVRRFEPETVRGATLAAQLSRAVAVALAESGATRAEIAQRMSDYLDEPISVHMLNAYASPARDQHPISMPRFIALLHATEDRRLLQMLAEPIGLAVVERRHLAMIELAAVNEQQRALARRAEELRRKAQGGI